MTDEELLAEMRKQYEYATLEDHMLVDGELYRRCGVCKKRPAPHNAVSVMWCDPCIDEELESDESLDEFVKRKRKEASQESENSS